MRETLTERRAGKEKGFTLKLAALRLPEREVPDDRSAMRVYPPSWIPGGGVVLDLHPATRNWQLPHDATELVAFHITLIGRKVFLDQQETMEKA